MIKCEDYSLNLTSFPIRTDYDYDPVGCNGWVMGMYHYHNDHLGTPQKMTDASGRVVWAADYKPFGEATITVSTITNNLRFPGQYFDQETGLQENYFRSYDPAIGRYKQADPIGLWGGINIYSYTAMNPLVAIDPYGLSFAGAADSISDLVDWLRGKLNSKTYGPADPITLDLQKTPMMNEIRSKYKAAKCKSGTYCGNYQYRALLTSMSIVGQTVGSFCAYITNDSNTMQVKAWNDWGLESGTRFPEWPGAGSNRLHASIQQMILSGVPPQWPKSILEDRAAGPMKTVRTHYEWSEPSPCCK